jgi:hypothetical protein
MKDLLAATMLIACALQAFAQEENSNNIAEKSTGYSLLWGGLETSTTSYIDTDSNDSSGVYLYVAPYIDYNHKSGFGMRIKSYTLPGGNNPGFYLTAISPYFARYNGWIFPYISYMRFILHDNPSIPYSPIPNEVYGHIRIKTRIVDPKAGIDIGFGEDKENNNENIADVNAFVGITHVYRINKLKGNRNNLLAVMPNVQLNAGTDRYYKFLRTTKYISQNTDANQMGNGNGGGNNSNGNGGSLPNQDAYTVSVENDFSLSNVEANLYIMYFFGDFSIEPSGSLYFPLRGDDRAPFGYWQLNLNYWLP